MKYDHVIEQALQDVQGTLSANLPPGVNLSDDRVVGCLRAIIGATDVQRAMEYGSDTALNFILRGVNRVLSETTWSHRATINRLREFIDRPELNWALGLPRDSRPNLWFKKPPTR